MTLLDSVDRNEARRLAPGSVAVLPLGSCEQHGDHLPLGTDTMLVSGVLDRALELCRTEPVRLPALPFGFSGHHQFAAALNLAPTTLLRVIEDLVDSLVGMGFRRILLVNGHGGNIEMMQQATKMIVLRWPVVIGCQNYWEASGRPGGPGHAGVFETNLMMAVRPDLVQGPGDGPAELPLFDQELQPGLHIQRFGEWGRAGGTTDAATTPDAAVGAEQLEALARGLADSLDTMAEVPLPDEPQPEEQVPTGALPDRGQQLQMTTTKESR